jgi:hypothetical protein
MKSGVLLFVVALISMAAVVHADALPRGPANPLIVRPQPVPQPAAIPSDQFIAQLADGDGPTVLVLPRDAFTAGAAHADAADVSPAPTIIAGFALSAAMVIGGLQLARGKRINAAILLIAAVIGIAVIARAALAAGAPVDAGHHATAQVDLTSQPTAVHITLSRDLAAFLTADALGNN